LAAMERLIEAQGRQAETINLGINAFEVKAERGGRIAAIDCERIARIARLAGAPMDKGAGIDLLQKTGARVRKGQALYRIHANSEAGLSFARELAAEHSGYRIA